MGDTREEVRSTTEIQVQNRNDRYRSQATSLVRAGSMELGMLLGANIAVHEVVTDPIEWHTQTGTVVVMYRPLLSLVSLIGVALVITGLLVGHPTALMSLFLSLTLLCFSLLFYRLWVNVGIGVIPPTVSVMLAAVSFFWAVTSVVRIVFN